MGFNRIQTTNTIGFMQSTAAQNFKKTNNGTYQKLLEAQYRILAQIAENKNLEAAVFIDSLKSLLELESSVFKTDRMGVWMLNKNQDKLWCIDLFQLNKNYHSRGNCITKEKCPTFFKRLYQEETILSVTAQSDQSLSNLSASYFIPNSINSVFYVPIKLRGDIKGFLSCEQTIAVKYWNKEEQKYMRTLAQFLALAKEMWERKLTPKSLIESEINLNEILNNNDASIWLIDKDYRLMDFNNKFKRKVNEMYNADVDKNSFSLMLFPEKEQEKWQNRYDHSLEGHRGIYYDKAVVNGTMRTYEIRTYPIKTDERFTGVSIFEKDVTAQEIAANKIKKIEKKNKNILQTLPDFVFECDREGKFINTHANKSIQNPFHISKNLLLNKRIHDVLNLPIADNFLMKINEVLSGEKKMASFEYKTRDIEVGTFKEYEARIISSSEDKVIVFLRDVTSIKRKERKLKEQNRQLIKLNKELDRFVYSASHDLRSPLTTLLGLIHIAEMESDESKKKKYFGLMEQSVKRLDLIIKDILNLSRNNRTEILREHIHFKDIITKCFDNYSYLNKSNEIDLITEIDDDCTFYSDPYRIEVLLNNLISNAIKFCNSKNPFICVKVKVDPDEARIEITDNGVGIKNEYLDKIFNMFFKGSEFTSGSGLGLYISKEISDTLKGSISITSKASKGTSVSLKIPNLFSKKYLELAPICA